MISNRYFTGFLLVTGDDDDAENEGASPSKKTKGKPGRKPGQKSKKTDQEAEDENGKNHKYSVIDILYRIFSATGDDNNTENEGESPTKKAKGKPGRKPGQTNKNASKKDKNQESNSETGNNQRSTKIYV